jgi:2-C-methyl-D-erythritol 4-phosphate cytidylyltransferase
MTLAILVAAGRGERLGADCPKGFVTLAGQPLLLRSALAFERSPHVQQIVAVVPAGLEPEARAMLGCLGKLRAVVAGGRRRQDSVLAGLQQAPASFDGVVLVHDAARPFADEALIAAVTAAAVEAGAAVPVVTMVDTVKRLRGGHVVETLDRSALGAAQTPQGFRFELLMRAYEEARRSDLTLTDEAMAVERIGGRVVAVPGSPTNRKITTSEDLAWAERFVMEQEGVR